MPAATAPLGKPEAAKPSSPSATKDSTDPDKPATTTADEEEEEENVGLQPVHLGLSVAALLVAGLFLFTTYTADQTPNRASEYLFGTPKVADVSMSNYGDDDDSGSSSRASSASSNDSDDEEDEEDDE